MGEDAHTLSEEYELYLYNCFTEEGLMRRANYAGCCAIVCSDAGTGTMSITSQNAKYERRCVW